MEKRKRVMNEKGFTLIEIIAVLVLLGILTAIAVPKYLSLSQNASNSAGAAALAAGVSNANQVFAQGLLTGTTYTGATLAAALNVAAYETAGDYTLAYADGAVTGVTCSITVTIGAVAAGSSAVMPVGAKYLSKTAVIAQ
ncbi:MAG: prepilin-type N-terminal cleavage/methylation domain-containing protein [Syntrophobacteraceae bacterium]|jgi:prepilin-type N-terminal cleavage/methylation domain-containing protein